MKKSIEVKDAALIKRMNASLKEKNTTKTILDATKYLTNEELTSFANKLGIETRTPEVIFEQFLEDFKRYPTVSEKTFIDNVLKARRKAKEENLQSFVEAISTDAIDLTKKIDEISPRKPNEAIGDASAYPNSTEEGLGARHTIGYLNGLTAKPYEMVNHPSHYNSSSIETIEKMRRIWGDDATALWCEMTAFKYRDRVGNKPDNSIEQEVGKIKWYESKAKELRGNN